MKSKLVFGPLLIMLFLVSSCKDDDETSPDDGNVQVSISHVSDQEPFELNKVYTNAYGNEFSVMRLKYFISNIGFVKNGDTTFVPKPYAYHLATVSGTEHEFGFSLHEIPEGQYDHIVFSVGVDRAANHDISRNEGDLDPGGSDGMIWDWDTGYKFLVLEGEFMNNEETDYFVFHVGNNENYKRYSLPKNINIKNGETTNITLEADVQQLFTGPNTINLEELNTAHGKNAGVMAENYAKGFISLP